MTRPLLPAAVLFGGGILAADSLSLPLPFLLVAALLLLPVGLAWRRCRLGLLSALIFFAGWTNSALQTAILSPLDLRCLLKQGPHLLAVRGWLDDTPTLRVYGEEEQPIWRTLARIKVTEVCIPKADWRSAKGWILISTAGQLTNHFAGEAVEISGIADQPRQALAEGTFDYRAYLRRQGIYYQLRADSERDWKVIYRPPHPPLADRFRGWGKQVLSRGLPVEDESLRLEWALTLGWKTALTEDIAEPFVQAAT